MPKTKKKILIVEDDSTLSQMMNDKFSHEGFDIDLALDGEEALDKVRKNKYDMVLLDILMPKMHGIEVLTQMRKNDETFKMPVIILTALDSAERELEAHKLGAIEYFVKSKYTLDDVVKKVRDEIDMLKK